MPTIDYDANGPLLGVLMQVGLAVLFLLVAHVAGKAVQWGLARLIDQTPLIRQHNKIDDGKETVGKQLGQLGYWLIVLIGLIAALTQLGLQTIVEPLDALLIEVTRFIPNLIGAAVLFFIGFILATLARRITETALNAARVDSWLESAGLAKMTGASGLARTAGALVFVLIIIPVTIAALQKLGVDAIADPAVAVLSTVLDAVPRVLAAVVVLAIAFVIGRWVAGLLEQLLPSLGFDRSLRGLGFVGSDLDAEDDVPAGDLTPSKIVARLALVAIMLFSAVEAANLLAFATMAVMLTEILELAGHVLFGGVIITLGVLIANFLASLIDRSTNGADGFASDIVRWATIALATAMGLRFMGIADEIVVIAFGLILGAAAVAAALAFGIGGRDTARRLLERWTAKADPKPPPKAPTKPAAKRPVRKR
jgi:hypothetical protein